MGYAAFILVLLGWMIGLFRYSEDNAEALPFVSLTGITLTLMLSALVGALPIGLLAVKGVGVLSLVTIFVDKRCFDPSFWAKLFNPAFIIFWIGLGILAFKLQGSSFSNSDEFNHWGLIGREILHNHSLVTDQFLTNFKIYPPAGGLLQYFFYTSFGDHAQYGNLAMAALLLSSFCLLFQNLTWRLEKNDILLTLLFAYFSVFALGHGVKSVLADHVLSVVAGCAFVYYLLSKHKGRYFVVTMACSFLVLMKAVGFLLAVTLGLFVLVDTLMQHKRDFKMAVLPLLISIAWMLAWKAYLVTHHVLVGAFSHYSTLGNIEQLLTWSFNEDQKQIIQDFLMAILVEPVARTPREFASTAFWLMIIGAFTVVFTHFQNRVAKSRIVTLTLVLTLGFVVYMFGLLSLYLFTFNPIEGGALAAFNRYVGIYIFMWVIIVFGLSTATLNDRLKQASMVFWVVLMVVLAPWKAFSFIYAKAQISDQVQERMLDVTADGVDKLHGVSIYIIDQGDSGMDHAILRNIIYPNRSNAFCGSLGKPEDGDTWSCNMSMQELKSTLSKYDYVWVVNGDIRLETQYGTLFPKNAHGLYHIHEGKLGYVKPAPEPMTVKRPGD